MPTTIRNPIEWSGAQLASAAHAAEAVGRSVDHMRQTAHSPAPAIRKISNADVWQSLREGFVDFEAYRSDVIFLCATYALVGRGAGAGGVRIRPVAAAFPHGIRLRHHRAAGRGGALRDEPAARAGRAKSAGPMPSTC